MSLKTIEWVGGHLPEPMSNVILWFETSSRRFVGFYREVDHDLASSLLEAIKTVPPPDRVRVAHRRDARRVREAVGPCIEVVVAPAPELDELIDLVVNMAAVAGR